MAPFSAIDLVDLFRVVAARLAEARGELAALDGAIGDADHGSAMAEGFAAVVRATQQAARAGAPAAELFPVAARSFLNAVGATTGPLYASAFLRAGQAFAGLAAIPPERLAELVAAFSAGIAERGQARLGDKTMLDAWAPAARAAAAMAADPAAAMAAALRAAEEGRDATRAMVASKGRAARLGERSLGHLDPGAASAVIILAALHEGVLARLARSGAAG
ncbi:MAG: dihydroxyacetone kinase subunit DhaL [Geminicoccaceae bacterium]